MQSIAHWVTDFFIPQRWLCIKIADLNTLVDHTCAKFSDKQILRTCAYQGVRNASFSENFAEALGGRSLMRISLFHHHIVARFIALFV